MTMSKEEIAMLGFEIVAYAGEARSKLMQALDEAEKGNFSVSQRLVDEAGSSLVEAHKSQTEMLALEASGEEVEIGFIMVHAQDHLMTTMLLRDTMRHLINIYKK